MRLDGRYGAQKRATPKKLQGRSKLLFLQSKPGAFIS